jgi:cation:H+ antiporter
MTILLLLVGLAMLAVGGEMLVRGAVGAARAFNVSPLLIGLTLVGFGTSTPELVTSVFAAIEGAPGIAIGNVVGSNTANILLILGITALVMPLSVAPAAFKRDGLALLASTIACLAGVLTGFLDRWLGFIFIGLLVAYILWAYWNERKQPDAESIKHEHMAEDATPSRRGMLLSIGLALIGIATTVYGARILVDAAIVLATALGVSDTVIGLTVVAVGTSLPELVACVVAALRRHPDVALGNIVGSNIYNVFGILGITAVIHPVPIPAEIARLDIWVLLGATVLLAVFLRTGLMLKRWEGGVFLGLYLAYVGWLAATA